MKLMKHEAGMRSILSNVCVSSANLSSSQARGSAVYPRSRTIRDVQGQANS